MREYFKRMARRQRLLLLSYNQFVFVLSLFLPIYGIHYVLREAVSLSEMDLSYSFNV
jgi:hypothetical protein